MHLLGIDHVGIAVSDIDAATARYRKLLGVEPAHRERVEDQGIEAVMFEVGSSRVELIRPIHNDSAVARFIDRRGGGLHHVAFAVADVQDALDQYKAMGLKLIDECPRRGAAGRLVGFLHPEAAGAVLVELCQPDTRTANAG